MQKTSMDKQQAQEIIKNTFEKPFNKVRFTNFIKNLLNSIDEAKAFHGRGYVKEGFRGVIKTYERIGTYTSADDKKIDIIIVYLQKGFALDHARVTQRNFAGRYLADRDNKHAGLFAFVSPEE
ncbi:MAG: class I SAM-dependent DNA methyltransferase, partial [Proteobacteria bacterium]|nr:class I SAM-dependent DNA methyltransferase [Pseudomonadota bacterium]